MDQKRLKQETEHDEVSTKKQLEKLGYDVMRLDTRGATRKRPEYLVLRGDKPFMFNEVKRIVSSGSSVGLDWQSSRIPSSNVFRCPKSRSIASPSKRSSS